MIVQSDSTFPFSRVSAPFIQRHIIHENSSAWCHIPLDYFIVSPEVWATLLIGKLLWGGKVEKWRKSNHTCGCSRRASRSRDFMKEFDQNLHCLQSEETEVDAVVTALPQQLRHTFYYSLVVVHYGASIGSLFFSMRGIVKILAVNEISQKLPPTPCNDERNPSLLVDEQDATSTKTRVCRHRHDVAKSLNFG